VLTHIAFIEVGSAGDPEGSRIERHAATDPFSEATVRFGRSRTSELGTFASRDRIVLRPVAVDGWLPRSVASHTTRRRVTGTLQVRLSRLKQGEVAALSAAAWTPVQQVDPSTVGSWAELAADTGRLVIDGDIPQGQVPVLAREAVGSTHELDPSSIQLRATVDQLVMTLLGPQLRRGPRLSAIVLIEESDDGTLSAGEIPVDILPAAQAANPSRQDSAKSARDRRLVEATTGIDQVGDEGLALLVRSSVARGSDCHAVAETVSRVQAALDHVACHLWLLGNAKRSLRQQGSDMHKLTLSRRGPSNAVNEQTLRRLWRTRALYLEAIEGGWSLGTRLPVKVRELVGQVDSISGISTDWADCERRLNSIGEAFTTYLELPDIPEGRDHVRRPDDRGPELSADALYLLREKNVFKQLWLLLKHWRQAPHRSRPLRKIELHPFTNRDAMFQELQASLTVTTLMTATAGIILGIILENRLVGTPLTSSAQAFVRPYDIVFLFISTFAFFFATMVSANAAGQLARHSTSGVEREIYRANSVTEYLGKYTFLVGLPMSVIRFVSPQGQHIAHATDRYIVCGVVILLATGVLGGYNSTEGIALLRRDVGDEGIGSKRLRTTISWAIPVLALMLFATTLQWPGLPLPLWIEPPAAVSLLFLFFGLTLASAFLPGTSDDRYFEVDDWDLMGAECQTWTDDSWRQVQDERAGLAATPDHRPRHLGDSD